jgi:predicted aldo/keto reductase-like oxidoreductase
MTTIEIYRYFSRLTMLVIAFTFILVSNYSAIASADLSASQTAALSEGATYFDTAVCDNSGSGGASSTALQILLLQGQLQLQTSITSMGREVIDRLRQRFIYQVMVNHTH